MIQVIMTLLLMIISHPLRADQIRERLYVETDKLSYLVGEDIQLKLVTTDAKGQPISFSKVGYVELLSSERSCQQTMIAIEDGIGLGHMTLPSSLRSGYYELVGYTRYMRSEGEQAFFRTYLTIINTQDQHSIALEEESSGPDRDRISEGIRISLENDRVSTRSHARLRIEGLPADLFTMSLSVTGDEFPVLKTSGIREWEAGLEAISDLPFIGQETAEYEGHIINGQLVDVATGAPSTQKVNTTIGFLHGAGAQIFAGQQQAADASQVRYYTKDIQNIKEVATTTDMGNAAPLRVDVTSPYALHTFKDMPALEIPLSQQENLINRMVSVSLRKPETESLSDQIQGLFKTLKPSNTYLLDEYTRFMTIGETVFEFVSLVHFTGNKENRGLWIQLEDGINIRSRMANPLITLDGIPILDPGIIYDYDPHYIKKIEVYRERIAISGQIFDGALALTTYNGDSPNLVLPSNSQIFDYTMPGSDQEQYLRQDINQEPSGRTPDFRHTMVYQPIMDADGQDHLDLTFCTSDLKGTFKVRILGMSQSGKTFEAVTYLTVE